MKYLEDVYNIPYNTLEKMCQDGVISYTQLLKNDVRKHFDNIRPHVKSDRQALIDCSIHFKISTEYARQLVKK